MKPAPHGNDDANRALLRDAGLRATQQRLAVLHALDEADGRHLSAEDIQRHHAVAEADVDRSTAYRILATLVDAGIVDDVRFGDGVARFEVQRRHHHHAVCRRCGATVDVHHGDLVALAARLESAEGFVLGREPQLLSGICRDCAAAAD